MDPERFSSPKDKDLGSTDAVELELLVRRSDEDVALFDSARIVETLIREAKLDAERARQISREIRTFIERVGLRTLSSSLIRGLVDAKLLEYGMEDAWRAHSRLGVPIYDVDQLMHHPKVEGTSQPHGPDGTSLVLAEAIKREYAVQSVLSEPVANAHLVGDIHIQDLGEIDRPYSLISSIDYIKQYGIVLPRGFASAAPARRPEVLIAHMVKFSAAIQGYLAGPIVWDSLNFSMAPYVESLDDRQLQQLAQMLLFEFSSPAVARGGQAVVCDIHLDWDAPVYMANRPAIGPGGEPLDRPYGAFTETAHRLLRAIFEAYLTGDARGRPFISPRAILHISQTFNKNSGYRSLLDLASRVATERGGLTIVFDREDQSSFFARYGISDQRSIDRSESADWRSSALQIVALNLPRVGYLAAGDQVKVFEELTRLMEAAAQAHLEKRVFLEKLLAQGEQGPLSLLAMRAGSKPFVKLNWTTHWINPVGLNELTRAVIGSELHQDDAAVDFAVRVVGHLRREADRLSSKHKVRFVLSELSLPSMAHRMARLDLRFFGSIAADILQSRDADTAAPAYSVGVRLSSRANVSPLDRLKVEGQFHAQNILNAGTEVWYGAAVPTPEQVAVLISQGFYQSRVASLLFAPEFTVCEDCGHSSHGIESVCPACHSTRVDGYALSGERYSLISTWDDSKLSELHNRHRTEF